MQILWVQDVWIQSIEVICWATLDNGLIFRIINKQAEYRSKQVVGWALCQWSGKCIVIVYALGKSWEYIDLALSICAFWIWLFPGRKLGYFVWGQSFDYLFPELMGCSFSNATHVLIWMEQKTVLPQDPLFKGRLVLQKAHTPNVILHIALEAYG